MRGQNVPGHPLARVGLLSQGSEWTTGSRREAMSEETPARGPCLRLVPGPGCDQSGIAAGAGVMTAD